MLYHVRQATVGSKRGRKEWGESMGPAFVGVSQKEGHRDGLGSASLSNVGGFWIEGIPLNLVWLIWERGNTGFSVS
jgi:hypothetical protein